MGTQLQMLCSVRSSPELRCSSSSGSGRGKHYCGCVSEVRALRIEQLID